MGKDLGIQFLRFFILRMIVCVCVWVFVKLFGLFLFQVLLIHNFPFIYICEPVDLLINFSFCFHLYVEIFFSFGDNFLPIIFSLFFFFPPFFSCFT